MARDANACFLPSVARAAQANTTRGDIEDITAAADKAHSYTNLYKAMVAHPGWMNHGVLWSLAKAGLPF